MSTKKAKGGGKRKPDSAYRPSLVPPLVAPSVISGEPADSNADDEQPEPKRRKTKTDMYACPRPNCDEEAPHDQMVRTQLPTMGVKADNKVTAHGKDAD